MGNARRHVIEACDASLRRLKTDWIDLYYIHRWDAETPIDETLGAFDDLRRAGKIRYAGCSNVAAWQMMQALWIADRERTIRFDAVQPRYNLLYRAIESRPVAGGARVRRRRGRVQPVGRRAADREVQARRSAARRNALHARDRGDDVPAAILAGRAARRRRAVGRRRRVARQVAHPRRVALGARPARGHRAIVGASRAEQLRDSLGALEITLDDQDRRACDQAWYGLPRRRPEEER